MCGLFGIQYLYKKNISLKNIEKDVQLLTKLSRIRGTDTFGISISSEDKESIFKINEDPKRAIKRKDYKLFLKKKFRYFKFSCWNKWTDKTCY